MPPVHAAALPLPAPEPHRGWVASLAALALALLCLLLAAPAHADAVVRPVTIAQAVAVAEGGVPDWDKARSVQLPHEWDPQWPGPTGLAVYRVSIEPQSRDGSLVGVLIERACSSAQISVNGHLLHQAGRMAEPVSRQCQEPRLVAIPAALLQPGGNQLEIRIKGYAPGEVASRTRAGGLSTVRVGPYHLLAQDSRLRDALAIQLPEVLSGTLVLMGGFMFVLGWFHRRQSYLAYFGALMVGWAVLLASAWATDLPWANRSTELMLASLLGFIALAGVQFMMRYTGNRLRWIDAGLPLQCGVLALSLIAAGPSRLHLMASLWTAVLVAQGLAAAWYTIDAARRRHPEQLWLMLPLVGLLGAGLLAELIAVQLRLDLRVAQLAQLIAPLALIGLGLRLVQQYGRALQSAEQGRAELEVRIREATAQIERNFAQLAELKVEQVTERERKRIAADLHDDLGAKLLTIVHTSDNDRISTLAREALEEMRLSVRGLTGKPVRLSDALGDWRAEVVSRLAQSGIEAEWHAPSDDDVPQTLSARAFVQTTRILREAVSNIIKHSGASRCSIRCTVTAEDFQLVVQDNGKGIPVELDGRLDKGHGMASMKGRAKQLRGQCLVESGPGYGTVIRLTLPLEQHVTSP